MKIFWLAISIFFVAGCLAGELEVTEEVADAVPDSALYSAENESNSAAAFDIGTPLSNQCVDACIAQNTACAIKICGMPCFTEPCISEMSDCLDACGFP